MLNNLFTSSPAMWAGLICGMIALPILIHLINRVRHKRIVSAFSSRLRERSRGGVDGWPSDAPLRAA